MNTRGQCRPANQGPRASHVVYSAGEVQICDREFGGMREGLCRAHLLGVGFTLPLRWFPHSNEDLQEICVVLLGGFAPVLSHLIPAGP